MSYKKVNSNKSVDQVELYNLPIDNDKNENFVIISDDDCDNEDEWVMIDQSSNDDKDINPRNSYDQLRSSQKKSSFNFLFKNRVYYSLYNMYHSKLSEPPKFSINPIWLLGKEYINKSNAKLRDSGHILYDHSQRFLQDFPKIIYFCYRKDFPKIHSYNTSTDIGWGCMARTGQMLLALSIRIINGYNIHSPDSDNNNQYLINDKGNNFSKDEIDNRVSIITLFSDFPDPPSVHPFSIHQIVEQNLSIYGFDVKNEFWFSPTKISFVLKSLIQRYYDSNMDIYVATDGVIYEDKIMKKEKCKNDELYKNIPKLYPEPYPLILKPLLILIPIRLGVDKINHMYIAHLKSIFRCRYTVGIIGGKPNKSMYFVGYQDDYVFYLDPHFVDTAIKPDKIRENIDSFSIKYPYKIKFDEMDPSMAIGFLLKNDEEYNDFKKMYKNKSKIFSIIKNTPDYFEEEEEDEEEESK